MIQIIHKKINEYRTKYIGPPGNVLEIGSSPEGLGLKDYFEDATDFCRIDSHRGPGIDIVADCTEVDKLFDYEPDVVVCVDIFAHINLHKKTINAVREVTIPGGFVVLFFPEIGEGSFVDAFFSGYEVFDVSVVDSTICGIAKKPYTIGYDS